MNENLIRIDKSLDKLVKKIELLSYVNPLNIASEKKRFFASKFNYEPQFHYPKRKFDGYKLQREFFSHRLEDIDDPLICELYEDIIYEYSGLIECIETIGSGRKFYYNSLKSFGTPTENDLENARFILRFKDNTSSETESYYNADEAADYFRTFSKRYDFTYKIKISSNISAAAMVVNSSQTLVLNKSHQFSQHQLNVLCNHEIGVHMVTTFNALLQPLKIFSNGFPNNVQTQEGLAVYSEFMSGNLSIDRLKELSYRVLAVDSLNKGYSFSDTFDLLHSQYKLDKNKAFVITQRVHRGGGFTKDHLYLSGLIKIYNYAKTNKDLQPFLMGKVAMEYESVLKVLQNKGLAVKPLYITDSYTLELEKEPTVKFILDSLD